jgi:predicted nicotinamide N-methyase
VNALDTKESTNQFNQPTTTIKMFCTFIYDHSEEDASPRAVFSTTPIETLDPESHTIVLEIPEPPSIDANQPFGVAQQGLFLWPAATLLCQYLLTRPADRTGTRGWDLMHGKRVLEMGSGVGLVAQLCTRFRPSQLIASDFDAKTLGIQ